MEKKRLPLISLLIGIILVLYSWLRSYPLSIVSFDDFVYNHISPVYWFSLSLMLFSLCLMAITSRSYVLRWVLVVGIFFCFFSISYFYFTLPTSDSQYFRGLNEYFISTGSLNVTKPSNQYFEWPGFFIFNKIATLVSAIPFLAFEFVGYAVIGFLLVTFLYLFFSKASKNTAFFAVLGFFLAMFNFLNYQWVPFTFAFVLFLALLVLDSKLVNSTDPRIQEKPSLEIAIVFLFIAISFAHAFVPMFFILYLLTGFLFSRERRYLRLLVSSVSIYFLVQIYQAPIAFVDNLKTITAFTISTEYNRVTQDTLQSALTPLDSISQTFSRFIVVAVVVIFGIGFLYSLLRKRISSQHKWIFVSGMVYLVSGGVVLLIGSRAIPLVFIPICSSGAYVLTRGKFRILRYLFLVLLLLFPFVLVHSSFYNDQIFFQTKETYTSLNYMIANYNWNRSGLILADIRTATYLESKQPYAAIFENDFSPLFPRVCEYRTIVYTIGLGNHLLRYNLTRDMIFSNANFNQVYDDGLSVIGISSSNDAH